MKEKSVDNLVICSTLNQITNYLIIKKYKPKRIFNITFDEDAIKQFNIAMKNDTWDTYLKKELKEYHFEEDIKLASADIYSLTGIEDILEEKILKVAKEQEIYWHITGGQRMIALAICELVKEKERINDRVMYIEGNTETLIINNNRGELVTTEESYGKEDLTFEQVFRLTGFDTKNLESTKCFKKKGQKKIEESEDKFYGKLNEIISRDKEEKNFYSVKYENNDYTGCFRDLLLEANSNTKFGDKEIKKKFLIELFKSLEVKGEFNEIEYDITEGDKFDNRYPAGYIFEKIVAYKIYDLIKDNSKIVGMEASLKTYFSEEHKKDNSIDGMIDELDIVLLTNTGKIINFECKSGGMKGDNAKSHNYTTYRLAGAFGMPILLSPLYHNETMMKEKDKNSVLYSPLQAFRAAKAAELEVFTIDEIKSGLKKLGIIEE